jgi:hypothetical protein
MRYLVVIGDVVGSKRVKARAALQRTLAAELAAVSAGHGGLASPYTLTLGDEFQAVYRRAGGLFADLVRIRAACLPAEIRLSVAVGRIVTAINPQQALGMDGPAFHVARERIERLKREGGRFAVSGDLPGDAAARDAAVALLSAWTEGWKPNRWRILLGRLQGRPVADLAAELGISEPAVYKNLHAGQLETWVTLLRRHEAELDAALTAGGPSQGKRRIV